MLVRLLLGAATLTAVLYGLSLTLDRAPASPVAAAPPDLPFAEPEPSAPAPPMPPARRSEIVPFVGGNVPLLGHDGDRDEDDDRDDDEDDDDDDRDGDGRRKKGKGGKGRD